MPLLKERSRVAFMGQELVVSGIWIADSDDQQASCVESHHRKGDG
jgi:hypothetical protein